MKKLIRPKNGQKTQNQMRGAAIDEYIETANRQAKMLAPEPTPEPRHIHISRETEKILRQAHKDGFSARDVAEHISLPYGDIANLFDNWTRKAEQSKPTPEEQWLNFSQQLIDNGWFNSENWSLDYNTCHFAAYTKGNQKILVSFDEGENLLEIYDRRSRETQTQTFDIEQQINVDLCKHNRNAIGCDDCNGAPEPTFKIGDIVCWTSLEGKLSEGTIIELKQKDVLRASMKTERGITKLISASRLTLVS